MGSGVILLSIQDLFLSLIATTLKHHRIAPLWSSSEPLQVYRFLIFWSGKKKRPMIVSVK